MASEWGDEDDSSSSRARDAAAGAGAGAGSGAGGDSAEGASASPPSAHEPDSDFPVPGDAAGEADGGGGPDEADDQGDGASRGGEDESDSEDESHRPEPSLDELVARRRKVRKRSDGSWPTSWTRRASQDLMEVCEWWSVAIGEHAGLGNTCNPNLLCLCVGCAVSIAKPAHARQCTM